METQVIHGSDVFDQLDSEWDHLVDRAMTATPFQSLAYQSAWWRHLGPGTLHTVAVRDPQGELCAIGCFYLLEGILYFNGCVEESDYLDLIVPGDLASQAWAVVFDALESDRFPSWQEMNLCNVPEDSPSRSVLADLASAGRFSLDSEIQEVCPVISLPTTFNDYLMALDKKQRHEIRRKGRRARAASARFEVVGNDANLEDEVDAFLELLQMSTSEKDDWLNSGRRAVFHEVARETLKSGILQLCFLVVEGQKAATLYNFDYKSRIWVYNSGFNFVDYGHLSPGVVLTANAIEHAIESGHETFDFLRGDETYKYRFGAEDTRIYRLHISSEETRQP